MVDKPMMAKGRALRPFITSNDNRVYNVGDIYKAREEWVDNLERRGYVKKLAQRKRPSKAEPPSEAPTTTEPEE